LFNDNFQSDWCIGIAVSVGEERRENPGFDVLVRTLPMEIGLVKGVIAEASKWRSKLVYN